MLCARNVVKKSIFIITRGEIKLSNLLIRAILARVSCFKKLKRERDDKIALYTFHATQGWLLFYQCK